MPEDSKVGLCEGVNELAVREHWRIRFLFLVVEGKSYATDETVFGAQNQAAVSGTYALKILLDRANPVPGRPVL